MPIYDLSYEHYDGPRIHRFRWWSVARVSAASILKNRRSMPYVLFIYFTLLVMAFLIYFTKNTASVLEKLVNVESETGEVGIRIAGFQVPVSIIFFRYLAVLLWPLFLFGLTQGPASVAAERQAGGLILVLARPIGPWQYVLGKVLGIIGVPLISALLCIVCSFILIWSNFLTLSQMIAHLNVLAASVLYLVIVGALLGLSIIGMSSVAKNSRTALNWLFLYWFAPLFFGGIWKMGNLEKVGILLSPLYVLDGLFLRATALGSKWVTHNPFHEILANGGVPVWGLCVSLCVHAVFVLWLTRRVFAGVR